MIKIEPACKRDLEKFEYDGVESELLNSIDYKSQLLQYYAIGRVYKVIDDYENVLMIYGGYQISVGVQQSWMLFNKAAADHAKSIAVEIRKILSEELKSCHRIQTLVFDGIRSERYIEIFGFRYEGSLKSFGPNKEDCKMYAITEVSPCLS